MLRFLFNLLSIGFTFMCLFAIQIIAPLGIQIILIFINFFVDDPIPYIDEIIQIIIFFGSMSKN